MRLKKGLLMAVLGIALCNAPNLMQAQQGPSMYGDAAKADVKMNYVYSFEEALKRAKEEKKLIFFNCFADWAVPCHQMNKAVFSDQKFCDYMDKHFVNLFVDVTRRGEGEALAEKYSIRTFAHYLVLDENGEVVLRIVGGKKLPEFQETLKLAFSDKTSLKGTEAKYNSGKYTKKDLANYLTALDLADEEEKFKSIAKVYLGMISPKEYAKAENWTVIRNSITDRNSDLYNYVVEHKADFVKSVGAEKVNNLVEMMYGSDLFNIASGKTPYDPAQMLDLYTGMQKADLPETSMCYLMYDVAKLRGEKKYAELIKLMSERGKELEHGKTAVELSFDFPEMSEADKQLVGNYLLKTAEGESGSAKKRLTELANAILYGDVAGIQFEEGTFAEALAKAKQTNKLVFMDCYTSWCGPCKMMSSKVFTQNEVGDYFNQNFVSIKVDMEKGEGIELAKKYKVSAYPTMLVLDAEGNVIYTLVGACDANSLVQQVRQHSDPSKGYAVCKKAYETGERTPEVVANYITVMIAAKEMTPQQGDSLANAYCQALSDQDFVAKETWMLLESCIFNPQGETFARMMKLHDALTKETEAQKVDKKIERVAFLYAIDYLRGVAGKDAVMAVLGQVKEGTYPDEYTLKLVYELLQLNDTAAVMDFFKTRVKNMKNAQDRLNMDTLIPYYMPKATDEQKKEMEKYIEETLQNCDRRAYNKYMDLYTVIKDGGYAD